MKCTGNSGPIACTSSGAPALDIPGDLTIQAWIHQLPSSSYSGTLATFIGVNSSYQLGFSDGALVASRFFDGGSGQYCGISRTAMLNMNDDQYNGKWIHVAAAYRASYALHLPSNVYVDCGHGENTDLTDGLTIEAWVKFDHNHAADAVLVSKSSYETSQSSYELSVATTTSSGGDSYTRQLSLNLWFDDGSSQPFLKNFVANSNSWHHLAATYHPENHFNYLYFKRDDHKYVELDKFSEETLTTFTVEMYINPRSDSSNTYQQSFLSIDRKSGQKDAASDYFDIGRNVEGSNHLSITIEGEVFDISQTISNCPHCYLGK